MVEPSATKALKRGKNLLAFSAGVDSTALYHLLKMQQIPFDIALVNYHTRPSSDEEARFAQTLATKDQKRCYIHDAPPLQSDFENEARKIRYTFFEALIAKEGYDTLVTAHHLDDMLEWALMQLCKGAGTVEMIGMEPLSKRSGYTLVRPLLFTPKKELLAYLQTHNLTYFIDESNQSLAHTRNLFRHEAARFLTQYCAEGIARSFRYLLADKEALLPDEEPLFEHKRLTLLHQPPQKTPTIRLLARFLKRQGYLASPSSQLEAIYEKREGVLGHRWAVVLDGKLCWIAPYRRHTMPKSFKERCRRLKIPAKIRPYLFEMDGLERLASFLTRFSS